MRGSGGKPFILTYGSDPSLLKTRRWVLEAAGFAVSVSTDGRETEQLLGTRTVALLLLCHSLTSEACRHALSRAASHSPETRRLLLDGECTAGMKGLYDATFDASEGPAALIEIVRRLTTARPRHAAPLQIVARRR